MSNLPPLPEIEPWPLAARLASAPASLPWTLISAPPDLVAAIAEEIRIQLTSLLEAPVELVTISSPEELVSSVRRTAETAVIVLGLEKLNAEAWRHVDLLRSRLEREQPAIIVLEESRLPLVVVNAPSFWSWLSGSVWRGALEFPPDSKTTE